MRRILIVLATGVFFASCHRPMMRATLENEMSVNQPKLTYQLLQENAGTDAVSIASAIDYQMNESGFIKTPFGADLLIYYRYHLGNEIAKEQRKIQVMVVDKASNTCIWKGETVRLPENLNQQEIMAYTNLLMQRFDWKIEKDNLLVRN